MIIDNADDFDLFLHEPDKPSPQKKATISGNAPVFPYIPQTSNGSVIFTTQDRRVAVHLTGNTCIVPVEKLSSSQAEHLLQFKLDVDDENIDDMEEFLAEVDNLPLAIVQAAAHMRENAMTISRYLQLYRGSETKQEQLLSSEFIDLSRDWDLQKTVTTTTTLSLDRIRSISLRATALISLMSLLDWQGIPRSLLLAILARAQKVEDFEEGIGTLKRFSIITSRQGDESFEIHRLTHLVTRVWARTQREGEVWATTTLNVRLKCWPEGLNHLVKFIVMP